jgi:2'-5' RNA ligase
MQSKCTWLGIGVELPPALTQACKEINTEILKINPQSYKFSQNTRPHLNLYDLDVPENNASEITSSLRNILKTVSSFEVKILKIGYFHFGAIFFEIEKHHSLLDLHSSVVSTVSKYKGNCICKDYLQPWREYTQQQNEMLKKYGNPFVMDAYYPHISLGFIKAPENVLINHVTHLNEVARIGSFKVENLSLVNDVQKGHTSLATFNLK